MLAALLAMMLAFRLAASSISAISHRYINRAIITVNGVLNVCMQRHARALQAAGKRQQKAGLGCMCDE